MFEAPKKIDVLPGDLKAFLHEKTTSGSINELTDVDLLHIYRKLQDIIQVQIDVRDNGLERAATANNEATKNIEERLAGKRQDGIITQIFAELNALRIEIDRRQLKAPTLEEIEEQGRQSE